MALKAKRSTTYTKTEINNSVNTKHIKSIFGEIPPTNTSRLFGYGDNKFRAITVSNPLSIQTTSNAYLTINADCYTKSEVNRSLALKQYVRNNVPGTSERLFEVNFLKRLFAVAPLLKKHIKSERSG